MKKKFIILIVVALAIIITIILINQKEKYSYEDENTLYYMEFDNEILRFERYDYALGQNQVIGVQKSVNKGKSFENITEENIIVSMEPKFIFLNKELGFAISKPNLMKTNNYMGIKVTQDGGKTFVDGTINYDNPNIEMLTVEDVPYYDNNKLKLKCSIYQVKEDHTGYENVKIILNSIDDGLTWDLSDNDKISMKIKENTFNKSGMTLIIKNNTKQTYFYGPQYCLEKDENGTFTTYKPKEPLTWNAILYNIKIEEEKEERIDWNYYYDPLPSGKYRLVKYFTPEEKITSSTNVSEKYYVEFEIK